MKMGGAGTVAYETPETLEVVGDGGMELGGAGTVEHVVPDTLAVVGEGGFAFEGEGLVTHGFIEEYAHVGSGGFNLGGKGIVGCGVDDDVLAITGSGGLVLSSDSTIGLVSPDVFAIVGSGGLTIGEIRVPELTVVQFIDPDDLTLVASATPVVLEMGGDGVISEVKPGAESVFAVPSPHLAADAIIKLGGEGIVTFVHPQIMAVIGDGEFYLGAEPSTEEDETGETLVLTGAMSEPSVYSNFLFNSYAVFGGRYYGAKPDGVYLLEGSDDAGDSIHSGLRIGPHNLGIDRQKRLRALRLGICGDDAQVRVIARRSSSEILERIFEVEDGKVPVTRDLQGREFTIEISDFEELSQAEIVPLMLMGR